MKKRWLLVLVAAIMLLMFPAVSLAGGGTTNETLLEGDAMPEVTSAPTEAAEPTPTEIPLPQIGNYHEIRVGETRRLYVMNYSLDEVSFSSADTTIAKVSQSGYVYGISEGTTSITVRVNDTGISCTGQVNVLPAHIDAVILSSGNMTLTEGGTQAISVTYSPASDTVGFEATWSSTNTSVVTVRKTGALSAEITAVGVGTAKVRATVEDCWGTITVTVVGNGSGTAATPTITASATPRPSSSAAEATSTPGPTRGAGESGGPQPTRVPVQLDATGWEAAEEAIAGMEPGSLGSIPMPDDMLVPASLLQTLQQSQCALEIDMGDYTCTIDGVDLAEIPDDFGSVDIGMAMEKDVLLSAECGGNAYELRFNYHGELPGVFTFRVKAEGSRPGDTVYVYFYDEEAGVFESLVAAAVDDQGYISFGITHCSSYYIASEMIPGAKNDFELPAEATEQPEVERASGFAAFIEDNYIAFWVCVYALGCAAVVAVFVVIFHRRGKKRAAGQQTHMEQ